MFRLVLTHQLVLAQLVGPMLCCCATTRLGHETHTASHATPPGPKPERKQCCGGQKSDDHVRQAPGEKPSDPAKCPCKNGPAKTAALPEALSVQADAAALFGSAVAALDLPIDFAGPLGAGSPVRPSDHRGSSLSTTDLLFAHHNLRC